MILHISRSRAKPHADCWRSETHWCYACRRHLPGAHILMIESPDSYYENWWRFTCSGCGEDHRRFPSA